MVFFVFVKIYWEEASVVSVKYGKSPLKRWMHWQFCFPWKQRGVVEKSKK